MSLRAFLAAFTISLALVGAASAQQPNKPEASVHRLKHIAAVDAAKALTAFADQKKLAATVVAEPVSNNVMIAGEPSAHKQLVEVLTGLDKEPPAFVAQMLFMEVPAGFVEDIGLGEESETKWVLTPREVRMLTAAIRTAKAKGDIDVLSRPQVQVINNQTGFVEVGGGADTLKAHVTPRVLPEGVQLRVDTQIKKVKGTGAQAIRAMETVPNDATLVMRGARTKTTDGVAREVLVVVTIHQVATAAK